MLIDASADCGLLIAAECRLLIGADEAAFNNGVNPQSAIANGVNLQSKIRNQQFMM